MPERLRSVLLWVTAGMFAISLGWVNVFADYDLWGRLAMGALLVQNGRFPYHDVFSYTASHAPWIDHEWLTGVVFYQVLAHFGETGFLVFKYLMLLSIFAWLFCLHRKVYKVSSLFTFYGLLLCADVYNVGLNATIRSQIFSFLFFVMVLYWLEQVRLGQKSKTILWAVIPVGVLWGNLHGGYAMLLLLLGAYGLGEMIQQRNIRAGLFHWLLMGLSLVSLGWLNPYGSSYLSFLFQAWTLDRSLIIEWKPLRFDVWWNLPAQLLFVVGTIIPLLRWQGRDKNDPQEVNRLITPTIVLFLFIVMMLRSLRIQPFVAWAGIAYLPLFVDPAFMARISPQGLKSFLQKNARLFCQTLPILIVFFSFGSIVYLHLTANLLQVKVNGMDEWSLKGQRKPVRYPQRAFDYLLHSPYRGNILVDFGVGEYALWRLYSRFKVSMDGRYEEVYSDALFKRNVNCFNHDISAVQQTFTCIHSSKADFILMNALPPVSNMLLGSKAWQLIYADPSFVILARQSTLKSFPAYPVGLPSVMGAIQRRKKEISIGDLFTDADLKRFKTSEY